MNSHGPTPFGTGLGLGLTSSLFFYTVQPYNFSYFQGAAANAPRSAFADRLDDYLKAGWIDTIHAYGDFDGAGGCTRQHAVATFRALEHLGVKLEVFSNHGSVDNVQNVGRDGAYHRGDRPEHIAYHADLLEAHGVRYLWTDSLVTPPADGDDWRAKLRRLGRPRPDLLEQVKLQDNRRFLGLRRLRGTGTNAPNLSSFLAQMELIGWDQMYASWGATFVYQHLGVLRRTAGVCEAATTEAVRARPDLYLAPFHRLKEEQSAGRLWVCGCAELARFVEMIREVKVRLEHSMGALIVEFPRPVETPEVFFAGLTIAVSPRREWKVLHAGRELPVKLNEPNTADGVISISVTRRPFPDIW